MSDKKAVFFDIDGTLWTRENHIPESTREAIRLLRGNGHLAFLCSGRSRAYITNPALLSLGFDGIVSGCGTMIEYHGETLFYKRMDQQMAADTVRLVREYGFLPVLEGRTYLYMDEADFAGDPFGEKLKRELGDRLLPITENWGNWEISKLSCDTSHGDRETCNARLRENFDLLIHNDAVMEVVPKGYHKGFGLLKTCELLGLDAADTFAVGDSVNDLEMFAAAGTAISMGNGSTAAKNAADYVTAPLLEDGVAAACRHFGLI